MKTDGSDLVTRRPVLTVLDPVTSSMIITVTDSTLPDLLNLPQALIHWAGTALLLAVGIGMIVPKIMGVFECPFMCLTPRTTGDSTGFGLDFVLGAAFVPYAGPVLTSTIVASSSGQITWCIVGLAISFTISVSILLMIVAAAGSGVVAHFLKTRRHPLRIAVGLTMTALTLGIMTDAPMVLQRMTPDYTAPLEVSAEGACEDGACEPEHEAQASVDFAQYACSGAKDCGAPPAIGATEWLNSLGEPHDTVTPVDFWSSSHVNYVREISEAERVYEKYRGAGFVVIGARSLQQVYERETSVVDGVTSRLGITYLVALDPELKTFETYGADTWPIHYLAGPNEQLRSAGEGTSGPEEQIRIFLIEVGVSLPN